MKLEFRIVLKLLIIQESKESIIHRDCDELYQLERLS